MTDDSAPLHRGQTETPTELRPVEEGYVPTGEVRGVEFAAPRYCLDGDTMYAVVKLGSPEPDGAWERAVDSFRALRQHNTSHLLLTLSSADLLYLGSRLLVFRGETGGWMVHGLDMQGQSRTEVVGSPREGPNLSKLWESIRHRDWPFRPKTEPKNDAAAVDLVDGDEDKEDDEDEGSS